MAAPKSPTDSYDERCKQSSKENMPSNVHVKKLSRTFSQDTTSSVVTWHSGSSALFRATLHEEDPAPHFEPSLCTPAFVLKICQWILCILCTGLFFEGSSLIYDFTQQIFPYIAYWTYMMITGVIIISYLLGQKMREILIRIYNVIGGFMFLTAAVIIFKEITRNWDNWMDSPQNIQAVSQNSTQLNTMTKRQKSSPAQLAKMLLTQSIMSFLNSILYFADTIYSLYISYKLVTYHLKNERK